MNASKAFEILKKTFVKSGNLGPPNHRIDADLH